MNLTPLSYSSKDEKELPHPEVETGISAYPVKKPGVLIIALLSIFKAFVALFVGFSVAVALPGKTIASGYPVWIFVYAYFLIALGVAYLGALIFILRYKRIGLILMAAFLLAELAYTGLLVIGNIIAVNWLGISFTLLMLSWVVRHLRFESQKSFFT